MANTLCHPDDIRCYPEPSGWHNKIWVHYNDVIMGAVASIITSLTIVFSIVYSGADQRKHQSSVSLAFVRGIHRWPDEFPVQMASNAEYVSIWWRQHKSDNLLDVIPHPDQLRKIYHIIWMTYAHFKVIWMRQQISNLHNSQWPFSASVKGRLGHGQMCPWTVMM